jgi:hypothetical protein
VKAGWRSSLINSAHVSPEASDRRIRAAQQFARKAIAIALLSEHVVRGLLIGGLVPDERPR